MYKLLALDLDGTLLNQENKISTQNINAVKRVIHQHGTVVLCSAVSMGDQEHDISMFQFSAVGVAMGNASDFVKSCADKVSQDNNHHGVAFAINQLWPL